MYNRSTNKIIDIEVYWANPTNSDSKPNWERHFSMIEDFNMNEFSALEFDRFANRLYSNISLYEMYKYMYYRGYPQSDYGKSKQSLFCEMVAINENQEKECSSF